LRLRFSKKKINKKEMAIRPQYGKTFWGNCFLQSLLDIDAANRLPRGKTLANKGAVQSIDIKNGIVSANVTDGELAPAHKVKISLLPFEEQQKRFFETALEQNPMMLAKLVNKQLPEALSEVADTGGGHIFAKSWSEWTLKCNCSEAAVPCRHSAAALFKLTQEIDENPFLVFELRGQDFQNWLQRRQQSGQKTSVEIPLSLPNLTILPQHWQKTIVEKPNFDISKIAETGETLLASLSDMPLFHESDFKTFLEKAYRHAAKPLKVAETKATPLRLPARKPTPAQLAQAFAINTIRQVEIWIWEDFSLRKALIILQNGRQINLERLEQLLQLLQKTEEKDLVFAPQWAALWRIFQFSEKLLQRGAFIPQLLRTGETTYRMRYIPATLDKNVSEIAQSIAALVPQPLIFVEQGDILRTQNASETVLSVASLFIGNRVKAAFWEIWTPQKQQEDSVFDLFFFERAVSFTAFGRTETPAAIHQWLSRFYLSNSQLAPVLQVEEKGENFLLRLLVRDKRSELQSLVSFQDFAAESQHTNDWISFLRDVERLREYFPDIEALISAPTQKKGGTKGAALFFDSAQLYHFFMKVLPVVQLLGVEILLPRALKHLVRPKVTLRVKQQREATAFSYLSLDELLDFSWEVAIGEGKTLTKDDFEALLNKTSGIVRINQQYLLIEPEEAKKILKQLETKPQFDANETLRILLAEDYEGVGLQMTDDVKKLMRELRELGDVPLPAGLKATLRPYQKRGFEWLYRNARLGFGSVLADDMGLGKTLQVITTILKIKEDSKNNFGTALVVVPTTLLSNWEKEIQKFAPSLTTFIFHGNARRLPPQYPDVFLTTYGTVRTDLELLKSKRWTLLAIDEAQNIKNTETEQTKAVKSLVANIKIAMSGTPVENRLSEYWSIFDFTNKGFLGSVRFFNEQFAKPIQNERDQTKIEQFRSVTRPFVLRRVKTDKNIISDLPDKIQTNQYAVLNKTQISLYQNVVNESLKVIENDGNSRIERQGLVLKMMMNLKQICNHPTQFLKNGTAQIEDSGKLQLLLETLDAIIEIGEKVLIFTQFQQMGNILQDILAKRYGFVPQFLHGGNTRPQRDQMVETFEQTDDSPIFILSLKAGGTGLNLTAANHVVHYDLWWNPAIEAQATDRAFRIGQKKNVFVSRMITRGTLEEKIDAMLESKKQLADLSLEAGESWIGNLSNHEIRNLVSLESPPTPQRGDKHIPPLEGGGAF
jgi:uncharacterized Zn finger protein